MLQRRSALARCSLGLLQPLLLRAQFGDVHMGVQANGIHARPCLHAHGAWPGQAQLKGRAREAQHLTQRVQALGAGLCLRRASRCPGLAEHVLQRAAQALLWIVQTVQQRKRGVHPGDGPGSVALHQPHGHAVQQRGQRPGILRQPGALAQQVQRSAMPQAPPAQSPHPLQPQGRHYQLPPPVLKGKGLGLPPVARNACVDIAVDALDLVGPQAPR